MEEARIRPMSHADLPQVHEMDLYIYETPWSVTSFSHELGYPDSILKVAEINGIIVGYICVRTLLDVTHLMKIGVLPRFRRRGAGRLLLESVLNELRDSNREINQVTLEVRRSNIEAINLYKKSGFHETGIRPDYYRRPDEDAIIMTAEFTEIKR